jgi:V/A-type H+-transporting ATPase subunit I
LESVLQLLINTISFIRVGAFALAHAGLSLAVIIISHTVDNLFFSALLYVFGNIVILILEGLVVSIQTTRLVLFEFFIRFLKATGRMFHPLTVPATRNGRAGKAIHSKRTRRPT